MKSLQCKCFFCFRHSHFKVQSDLPWLWISVLPGAGVWVWAGPLAVLLPRAWQPPSTEAQQALGLCSCQQDPTACGWQVFDKESRIWEKEGK